jgi:Flp pilus assembly protein protease CpaA
MVWLFLYTLALSLYDLRTGKVPNWATLPLLAAGCLTHFPGALPVWLASLLMFVAWHFGQMGAGDAKLWMAVFWAIPPELGAGMLSALFASFLGTALLQLLFRRLAGRPLSGRSTPAAWRTLPFVLWAWYVH